MCRVDRHLILLLNRLGRNSCKSHAYISNRHARMFDNVFQWFKSGKVCVRHLNVAALDSFDRKSKLKLIKQELVPFVLFSCFGLCSAFTFRALSHGHGRLFSQ